jgi:lipid-binding SYLF domain-containing protein
MSRTIGSMPAVLALVLALVVPAGPAAGQGNIEPQQIVDDTDAAFKNLVADPNLSWFRDNLQNAKGIMIVPQLVKGGFFLGGSGGSGVVLAHDGANGSWSDPAFYTIGSVSFGLQFGGEVSEVAFLVMIQKGMDSMLETSFKLGGDVSIAAGPVGAGAKAATADILAFSRSKGLFGGISLEGSVIGPQNEWNSAYYAKGGVQPADVLLDHKVSNKGADALREAVARAAKGS